MNVSKFHFIYALILFFGTIVFYFPSVYFDFTIDDPLVTTINEDVKDFEGNYSHFFTTSMYAGTFLAEGNDELYRPILQSSMAFNYQLSNNKFEPFYFHLFNVLLYGFCVVVVFYFIKSTFNSDDEANLNIPFLTALLFMVFPSHLESVSNIKHREEILAFFFSLLSWLIVLKKHDTKQSPYNVSDIVAALLFLLALLSKESALLVFPCIIIWRYIKDKSLFKNLWNLPFYFYTFTIAILVYFILRYNALGFLLSSSETRTFFNPDENLLARILVTARIFVDYYLWDQLFSLKLDPFFSDRFAVLYGGKTFIYDALALIFLLSILLVSTWKVFKARGLLSFWILFFFITSFLATNIIPINTVGAFRLVFTPSLSLCVIITLLLMSFSKIVKKNFKLTDKTSGKIFVTSMSFLILIYGYVSYVRMSIWENNGAIFSYSARVEPGNPISHYYAGNYYDKKGVVDKKYTYYENALNIFLAKSNQPDLFNEQYLDYFSVVATEIALKDVNNNPMRAIKLSDLAIEQFEKLQRLRNGRMDTNITGPYYVKALALRDLGYMQESINTCRKALAISYHRGIDQLLKSLTTKL